MKFTKIRKITAAAVALCTIGLGLCGCGNAEAAAEKGDFREMTTMEIVQDMGLGINLGNTFESCGDWLSPDSVTNYERGWGSPQITQEMIQGYKDCGFDVLRVPVAWSNMMLEDYTIHPDYLARVKEVVEWALDADLYVILNIHWDGGWFENFGKDDARDEAFEKYESVWTQLTAAFNDEYSDKLMFESLNEEGGWNDIWNQYSKQGDKEKSYGILNDMNQRFVNIVRKSGGNNEKRHLLIAGYNTDIELTCDPLFKMPDDPAGRCAVSVHYYTPSTFTLLKMDADWGKAQTEWGSDSDIAELDKYMDMVKNTFADNGVPVIIGEYACTEKINKTPEVVRTYTRAVAEAAYTRGMCPVLWDVTNDHYNRNTQQFKDPVLLEELMAVKDLERNK